MSNKLLVLVLLAFSFSFLGCGEKKSDSPLDESSNNKTDLENYADKMKEVSEGFTEGKKVDPVDFRELKALLPESIGNLKRSNLEGEKVAAMGMNISNANADYNDDESNVSIDLKITDLGSVSGLSGLAAYGWYMVDIDKENDNGYEKTITYKGNKGYEKYNNENKDGEISILVAKRFVIEANGNNVSMDQMKAAVDMIDIGKLESWKDFGVEK
ncbi:MAG: transposase [Ignavibacteriales bacterium]|nr:transposase [Ignavibacteriales bacterium]